jgi:carbon storage regulator
MLVLSRRIGEEIIIAGDIRVTVVSIRGKQVRIGITAPASVHVVRHELLAEANVANGVAAGRGRRRRAETAPASRL